MRIGIFDSGLGGLVVTSAIIRHLPQYDYVYLGDTARVPYGDRSQEVVYQFTEQAVDYLFREQDCHLIILACNTASAEALRRIQQTYLPTHYPERRVLGVIIPTIESVASEPGPIGLLATRSTITSNTFARELQNRANRSDLVQVAAPLLVPIIENDALQWASPIIESYVAPLREAGIKQLILGCTHYGLVRNLVQEVLPGVQVIAEEDIIPKSLSRYLEHHPEHCERLSSGGNRTYLVTDLLDHYASLAQTLGGESVQFQRISLS